MTKKIITLLGLPGSGKGTQGAFLSSQLKIPHISTGEVFRRMAKGEGEGPRQLNEYLESGRLVPSDLANKIVQEFIISEECRDGCILDGYPRTLEQAEYLTANIDIPVTAIFFDVKADTVIKRILGRYNCLACGALYNKYFDAPKTAGVCDSCGSREFVSRRDDDERTVLSRVEEYRKETLPLVEYYKKKGDFFTVNAQADKKEVMKEVSLIAKRI